MAAQNPFILDFDPAIGRPEVLGPGLSRLVAPNPSAMTFRGTNTYLVGGDSLAVIDPGPDDPRHLAAILAAVGPGRRISHILVTHAHVDHSPLARRLSAATGAPVVAFGPARAGRNPRLEALGPGIGGGEGIDTAFAPDMELADGETLAGPGWTMTALWTPGHMGNHLCFAWAEEGALFSGDHVMSWATTMVSPPDGDLSAFMASLEKLQGRADRVYHPGHGAPLAAPGQMLAHQLAHRRGREAQILRALEAAPGSPAEIAARIYTDIDPRLMGAAARNVLAHLLDLEARGLAGSEGPLARDARFHAR